MNDLTNNLVKNPINRWAIGSQGGCYKKTADGSLTLYLQKASPGKDKEANWLPAPDGPLYMVMRLYGPEADALEGKWMPPKVEKTN